MLVALSLSLSLSWFVSCVCLLCPVSCVLLCVFYVMRYEINVQRSSYMVCVWVGVCAEMGDDRDTFAFAICFVCAFAFVFGICMVTYT